MDDVPAAAAVPAHSRTPAAIASPPAMATPDMPSPLSDEQAAAGYWMFSDLTGGTREQRKALELGQPQAAWAGRDAVRQRLRAGGAAALDLMVALLAARPDTDSAGHVGAGPLEDLLHEHGNGLAEQVAARARSDRLLAAALGSVWLSRGAVSPQALDVLAPWLPAPAPGQDSAAEAAGGGPVGGPVAGRDGERRRSRQRSARLPRSGRTGGADRGGRTDG